MASPALVRLKQSSLDLPDMFQGRLFLAVMEGLRDLQADLFAWLQLEIPSQGQHPQGSEQRVGLGAGKGQLS